VLRELQAGRGISPTVEPVDESLEAWATQARTARQGVSDDVLTAFDEQMTAAENNLTEALKLLRHAKNDSVEYRDWNVGERGKVITSWEAMHFGDFHLGRTVAPLENARKALLNARDSMAPVNATMYARLDDMYGRFLTSAKNITKMPRY